MKTNKKIIGIIGTVVVAVVALTFMDIDRPEPKDPIQLRIDLASESWKNLDAERTRAALMGELAEEIQREQTAMEMANASRRRQQEIHNKLLGKSQHQV